MRPLLVLFALLVSTPALAQSPLFSPLADGKVLDTRAANPHVRVATALGIAGETTSVVGAIEGEIVGSSPLSFGGRLWGTSGSISLDAGSLNGGGGEAFARLSTRTRWIDLRAGAGLGFATIDEDGGFIVCGPMHPCPTLHDGPLGYVPLTMGLDVYTFPGVGIGAEYRYVVSTADADLNSVEFGLRFRAPR